jgi:predicted permease
MFVNGGNYGLSLNLFAFGESAMARAVVYYIVSTVGIYSLGVFVASNGRVSALRALKAMIKVPALYALTLAGVMRWQAWVAPSWVQRPTDVLAAAAIPVMLLILGMQMAQAPRSLQWRWVGLVTLVRMLVMPLIAFGLANLFHLTGPARRAGVIEASMPSAVLVTVLAIEYDLEPMLVTEAVVFTTLVSPITLTPLIALLQV